ncbi:MAG TPA: VanZ family protein [Roseovarius sp.]|nr:VanZ family protein [Roseovarius sp.]
MPQNSAPDRPLIFTTALTLTIAGLIAWATLSPPGPPGPPMPYIDKVGHATAFAALIAPLAWHWPRALVWGAPLALLYGGVIELVQPGFGRSAEWADFWADGLGVVVGCLPGLLRARRSTDT